MERLGANYKKAGPGVLRAIPKAALDEIKKIFDETGATDRFEKIEAFSKKKAAEMGMKLDDGLENEYITHIYKANTKDHSAGQ
jgi:heterodisulfide reductase subunit C